MSKAKKNIEIEIKELKGNSANPTSELLMGRTVIGKIKEVDGKFEATNSQQRVFSAKTFDEGIAQLIKDFHLHH